MNDEHPITADLQTTQYLREGILAFQAGNRTLARRQLARAALTDPNHADAWLWLSRCIDDPAQRQECRERAQRLNQRKGYGVRAERSPSAQETAFALKTASVQHDMPGAESVPLLASSSLPTQRRRRHRLFILALATTILIGALVLRPGLTPTLTSMARLRPVPASLIASGIIEADEIEISSETSGRIASIPVAGTGETIRAGDLVVQLDTIVLDAQIEAAQAALALAKAHLELTRAGARPGQIAVAEAELLQAKQARLAAAQAVSDTAALVNNPQEIRLQIALLEAQVQAEQHRLAQNLAIKNATEVAKDAFQEAQDKIKDAGGPGRHKVKVPGGYVTFTVPSLPLEAHLAPNHWWQAWVGVNATAAQKEGLEASLAHLYARRQDPQALRAQADEARATAAQSEAQVLAAQVQVDGLYAEATTEQIAARQARVDQAQAALDALLSAREKRTLRSPIDGVVLDVTAHPGEVTVPGALLVTLADLDPVRLRVYVPEPRLGQVQLGQPVQVTADSLPDQVYKGRVAHMAERAEFTPRNVATSEERANLVFAVEIDLPNEDGALKPGMPADAVWE